MDKPERSRVLCIAATFTAEPVEEGLHFWFRKLGATVDVVFAPYGQVFQSLLDPTSELGRNRHGANVLFVRWGDLQRADGSPVQELVDALRESCERTTIPHLIVTGPAERDTDCNEQALDDELREKISQIDGIPLAHLITGQDVQHRYPMTDVFDADANRVGHVPYTEAFFAALATSVARAVRSLSATPRKVIVLDCDNTLWDGVVGEDGPDGVGIDGPFAELQSRCLKHAEDGKLLCLASKNVEADAWAVFDRQVMPLRREHVTAHRINWLPKSQNLRALAQELGLGLDSFVFVDDSPVECGEVRAACPEVLTVELPKNPADRPSVLDHLWALDQLRVTADDRKRAQTYKDNAARGQMRSAAGSLEAFLKQLELDIDIRPARPDDVPRIAQLSQRTNQFNATTRRREESEVRALLESGDPLKPGSSVCRVVSVRDRFGDYGLVGVLMATVHTGRVDVDNLMLSCRALGRGVEHAMLAHLGRLATDRQLAEVRVPYLPTARNEPIRRFLDSLDVADWAPHESEAAGAAWYVLDAEDAGRVALSFDEPEEESASPSAKAPATSRSPVAAATSEHDLMLEIATELSSVGPILAAIRASRQRRRDLDGYAAPRAGLEQSLAAIWQEVLGMDRVGVRDRFSDLGGTSLHLVRIHGLVVQRLGVDVELTALFSHSTVESLARWLADRTDGGEMAQVRRRADAQKRRRAAVSAQASRLQATRRGAARS